MSLNLRTGPLSFQLLVLRTVDLHQREMNNFPHFKAAEHADAFPVTPVFSEELQLQTCSVICLHFLFCRCAIINADDVEVFSLSTSITFKWRIRMICLGFHFLHITSDLQI